MFLAYRLGGARAVCPGATAVAWTEVGRGNGLKPTSARTWQWRGCRETEKLAGTSLRLWAGFFEMEETKEADDMKSKKRLGAPAACLPSPRPFPAVLSSHPESPAWLSPESRVKPPPLYPWSSASRRVACCFPYPGQPPAPEQEAQGKCPGQQLC